jgi:ABC-type uncharacterized transport system involved in gliding motility auxiliary subunit
MKKKGIQTTLFSAAGVAAIFAALVAFNWIAGRVKTRIDLTSERAYTLSEGTRKILSKLDTPVLIRFYCTRGDSRMPVFLKNHAQNVEDLLGEYRQRSKGLVEIQKLDPEPDSDAEDSAKLDGVEARMTEVGEPFYLGLSVTMLDQKETVPFLDPQSGRLLEYEISRAISRVMTSEKPTLGILSALPVAGQQNDPMMMMRGRQGGAPAWYLYTELKRTFNVKQIETNAASIPEDVKVLLAIHPKGLSDATQYALDQFVLRGGKLIAFLDPLAALDPQGGGMMGGGPTSSTLEKLLKAWGITFDTTKVVADMNYTARLQQGRMPAVLQLNEQAVNKDDVLTAGNDNLFFGFAGAFAGSPVEGLKQTVLVHSSQNSQLIDPMQAQMGGEQIVKDFVPSGVQYNLAIRLTGKFKTAFPDGKPKAADEAKPGEEKPAGNPAEAAGLKEAASEGAVVLVGDTDLLQDQLAVEVAMNPFGGQRIVIPRNSNIAFAQGAVEQMAGDSNLIAVRSRAARERPFTVVAALQAKAEENFRSKIKELEAGLAESQRKLNELQRTKAGEGGQKFILSPEQQQEIANFRRKEAEAKVELKQVRKKLRADIDSLENRIKWLNIAGMPAAVIAAGVILALRRRARQAAR